jgi:PAS domain S-box-containing protein
MSTDTPAQNIAQGTTPADILGRVDEAILALDSDWRFTYLNDRAATLVDRDPSPLLGESLWEQFPAVADSPAFDAFHEAIEQQEPRRFDMAYEPRDAWFTVRAYPSPDGVTVCFHEVTEERQAELELQRSRRLFESVFDETNDALVVADTDRRITDFNPAAERLFGYDASEVIGERSELLYADTAEFERQGTERYNEQAAERHDRYVVEYERADGTTFEGETVGTPLEGQDGETLAFFATVRDVTSRVEYERDIERRNRALKRFHEITTDESDPFEEQVTAVLDLATDYLDLETGVLAETEGEASVPRQAYGTGDVAAAGERRDLEATFADRLLDGDGPFGFHDAAEAGVDDHPACQSRGTAAYLGTAVHVEGEPYGTLAFASMAPRAGAFSESEETFVRIVAQWVGKEISRLRSRDRASNERERLRQIIDALPQQVFLKNADGTYTLANEAAAAVHGVTAETLEGASDETLAFESDERDFRADDMRVIESGESIHIEADRFVDDHGTERIVQTDILPFETAFDDRQALVVTSDITEQKRLEARLDRSQRRLRQIIDMLPQLVFAKDDSGRFLLANEAVAEAYGTTVDELEGATVADVADSEAEAEQYRADDRAVIDSGEPKYIPEEPLTTADGTEKIMATKKIPYDPVDTDGDAVLGVATDITERKQREAELEMQSAAMEASMDGISIFDADGNYIYMNEAHAAVFDHDPDELMGSSWRRVYGDAEVERLEQEVFPALDREGQWRGETVGRRRDGTPVDQEITLSLLDDGKLICTNRDTTEQQAREEELEQKRSRLRALFDESPDGIIVHDERGEILDANTTQADLLGYPPDELRSMNVAKVEAGFGRPELRSLWESMDVGDTRKVEGNHRRKTGAIYPVEVWISKTELRGQPRFIAISRDISERREREREMTRNRDFLEKTQEIAAVGGWEIDLRQDRLQWTEEVYNIHDLPTDTEVTVEDGIDYYHPDDRPALVDAYERLVEAGEPYDLELRIVTAADEVKWVRTIGDPEFDDGEVVGVRGIFQDITERKERERDVQELTERLDLAVEGANLGVWDWDMTTDAVTFNEQWATMLGLSLDELEPTLETWEERIHPADMDRVEAALEAHLSGAVELYDCDHRMRTASGEWKWVRDVGEVVERDEDGEPTRAVGIHLDISDQKESEQALAEERDMFAQGPAVVFKWQNEDGWPVEYVSENVAETFGYTPAELESGEVPYETLIHEDDRERVAAEVEAQSDADVERFSHDPYRMVTADGAVKWVTDNTKVIRIDGEITHYLGYLIDITDRKQLEQSLRQSEQSLRRMTAIASDSDRGFEAKLDAVLELGCERLDLPYGFLTRINDGTQNVVEAAGTHPDLQPGASAPMSKAYCRRTIEQDEPLTIQNAAAEEWPDDDAYEAFGLGCYIGGKVTVDGDLYGTLCFAGDDDRDHRFDESERAFVELLVQWVRYELASDAVETKLRQLNETAQRLLSAGDAAEVTSIAIESARDVLDLPVTGVWWYDEGTDALVPAGMTEEATALLDTQPALDEGDSLAWQTFQDGEIRLYGDLQEATGRFNDDTLLRSEIIVPLGQHGVLISGSTEQRAFSETDRGLFDILAATVETALNRAEREQELRDTRERLEQSNQELEQFAYAASHDLQEPLRTVSSYLTLLERRNRDVLDEDAMEFIDFAVDGADRMQDMIQALLEYSRVDTRGQAFERTDMETVFGTVTNNLEVTIAESGATVDLPDSPGHVVGDVSQLVQLFQNLVENAVKYTDGEPLIDISLTRADDDVIEYAVADDGIGMEPEQLEDIFEVFQRLHTRAEFEGTGIGLSICRKIVDRHDGEIRVESTPGEGSTFFVTLPVAGEHDA